MIYWQGKKIEDLDNVNLLEARDKLQHMRDAKAEKQSNYKVGTNKFPLHPDEFEDVTNPAFLTLEQAINAEVVKRNLNNG